MTETCGGCVYDGVPLDGVEVDVGGAQGRIRLRGPVLADGERAADGGVTPVVDPDGWLPTGDVGALVDGRLVVHGRADHVILTGGENVAPEAVERVLAEHAEVLDAGVLGREDPEWGQRVVALVVPRDPVAPPTPGRAARPRRGAAGPARRAARAAPGGRRAPHLPGQGRPRRAAGPAADGGLIPACRQAAAGVPSNHRT